MKEFPTFDEWFMAKHGCSFEHANPHGCLISTYFGNLSRALRDYTTELMQRLANPS